eukprot:m.466238 g.466238  ORF g.466238 m.466238 type:complete len:85 (+) comp25043_c0_seq1:1759-2013(+)
MQRQLARATHSVSSGNDSELSWCPAVSRPCPAKQTENSNLPRQIPLISTLCPFFGWRRDVCVTQSFELPQSAKTWPGGAVAEVI